MGAGVWLCDSPFDMTTPAPLNTEKKKLSRGLLFGVSIAVAVAGPSITHPRERAANAPFSYTPPEGFVPSDAPTPTPAGASGKMWMRPRLLGFTPRLTLTHTEKRGPIDDGQLREVARGMPSVYRESQVTWNEVRHEVHVWGEGKRDADNASLRTAQMLFPDDTGTSLLTVSYGVDDGTNLEQQLMASADLATGVALRGPGPPSWLYGAWGAGGLVFALLLSSIRARKKE
jgi:hypothetical protein